MAEVLTFTGQMDNCLTWMVAGWATYVLIWTTSKIAYM